MSLESSCIAIRKNFQVLMKETVLFGAPVACVTRHLVAVSREALGSSILYSRNPVLREIRYGRLGHRGGILDRIDVLWRDEVLVAEVLLDPAHQALHVDTSLGVLTPLVD